MLDDKALDQIIENMKYYLKIQNYDEAVRLSVNDLA